LNYRQQRFLDAYLVSGNGSDAATKAGYAKPRQAAVRLLTNVYIAAEIKSRLNQGIMEADEVLERLAEQARINIYEFINLDYAIDDEGNEVARYSLNWEAVKEKGHLIKTITSTSKGHPKIELHDGQTALIHLGKHHRLFVDRVDVTSDGKSIQTVGFDANKI